MSIVGIVAAGVNDMFPLAARELSKHGVVRPSRNGRVIRFPRPIMLVYEKPWQHVMLWRERDANPFLHLFEFVWMSAGRNDVRSVARFAANMKNYSDDGLILWGAYGHRWRNWFNRDQLVDVVSALAADPTCRRQVLSMWDPGEDPFRAAGGGKDVPCNTHAYVEVDHDDRLNLTVCNRSNDLVWGALGSNVVHFSLLHQFLAEAVGAEVGVYNQFSNNMHVYEGKTLDQMRAVITAQDALTKEGERPAGPPVSVSYDPDERRPHFSLLGPRSGTNALADWYRDVDFLLDEGSALGVENPWLRRVAHPMIQAHSAYRMKSDPGRFEKAREILGQVRDPYWRVAAEEWLDRREIESLRAADDGPSHEEGS